MEECGKEEESCCSVCSQVYDTETTYWTKKLSTEDYGTANFYPSRGGVHFFLGYEPEHLGWPFVCVY